MTAGVGSCFLISDRLPRLSGRAQEEAFLSCSRTWNESIRGSASGTGVLDSLDDRYI